MARFGKVLDTRDGKVYRTVLMPDGKWWMAEDLQYAGCGVLGKFYRQMDFGSMCFPGSHIPWGVHYTNTEWEALIAACGGSSPATAAKLKSTSGWSVNGTDDFGFNAKPTGGAIYTNGTWQPTNIGGAGVYGAAWLSDPDNIGEPYTFRRGIRGEAPHDFSADSSRSDNYQYSTATSVRLIVDSGNVPDDGPPTIYPEAGAYSGIQYIGATSTYGTIHYTLDGTEPTASSPTFTTAIKISSDTVFKAVAVDGDFTSPVSEASYVIQGAGVDIVPIVPAVITEVTPVSNDILRIPGYPAALQHLLLEQYKADNR